jgi:hypothetical protein
MSELTNNTFKKHLGLLHNRLNEIATHEGRSGDEAIGQMNTDAEKSPESVLAYLQNVTDKAGNPDFSGDWDHYRGTYYFHVDYPGSRMSSAEIHVTPNKGGGSQWEFLTVRPHQVKRVNTLQEIGALVTDWLENHGAAPDA